MSTPAFGPIDPAVDIGHVHLKVADIDRALAFYVGVLGFEVMARMGDQAAFISEHTVRSHVKSVLRKLNVSSRREALEQLALARG